VALFGARAVVSKSQLGALQSHGGWKVSVISPALSRSGLHESESFQFFLEI
jgi:hypothetical protein